MGEDNDRQARQTNGGGDKQASGRRQTNSGDHDTGTTTTNSGEWQGWQDDECRDGNTVLMNTMTA
jgi:hypothetical protein